MEMYDNPNHVETTFDENKLSEYLLQAQWAEFVEIKKAIHEMGLTIENADLEWVPKNTTDLPDDQAKKAYDFLSALDDHDDVQNVYTNLG